MLITIKKPFILTIINKLKKQELIFVQDTKKIILMDKFFQNLSTNYLKISVKILLKKFTNLFCIKKLKNLKSYLHKMNYNKPIKIDQLQMTHL